MNFRILVDSKDVSKVIQDNLKSMTLVDNSGFKSDGLTIILFDPESKILWPKKGVNLDVSLRSGVGSKDKFLKVGLFTVDRVLLSGPPDVIKISATPKSIKTSLKVKISKSYDDTTLGNIVREIGNQEGLEVSISKELDGIKIDHIDQTSESNLHFLTRLAKQFDAVAKPVYGKIIFVSDSAGLSSQNKRIESIVINKEDTSNYSFDFPDQPLYTGIKVTWKNNETGETNFRIIGQDSSVKLIPFPFLNEEMALSSGQRLLKSSVKSASKASISLAKGDSSLMAQTPVLLQGFRADFTKKWFVKTATHTISSNGFLTKLELTTGL